MKPTRLLILFSLGVLAMVAILSFGFMFIYERTAERHMMTYGQMALDSEALYVNAISGSTKDLLDSVSLDADISRLLNYENVSASDLLTGLRRLSHYESSNYFIDSIYIFNRRNDMIYVSSPHMPEAVYPTKDFPDFGAKDIFMDYSGINNLDPIFRIFNPFFPSIDEIPYLSFIRYNTLVGQNESNVIMVNIRQDMLSKLIDSNEVDGELLLLLDNSKSVHAIAGNKAMATDSLLETVLKRMERSPENFSLRSEGKRYIVCQTEVLNGRAKLAMVADEDVIDSITKTKGYGNAIVLLALLFGASLLVTAFIFRFIWKNIKAQHEAIEANKRKEAETAIANRRSIILSALHSGTSLEAPGILQENTVEIIVAIFAIDNYPKLVDNMERIADRNTFKERLCSFISSCIDVNLNPLSTYEDDERCVLIIQNPIELPDMEKMKDEILSAFGITVSVFVSDPCTLDSASSTYEYLSKSLSYRSLLGPGVTVTRSMVEEQEMTPYSIPDSLRRKMAEEILKLNTPGAMVHLREILDGISGGSYRSAQASLVNLSSALEDAISKLQRNNGIEESSLSDALLYKFLKMEYIAEIYGYIENILHQTELAVEQNRNSRQSELVNEIVRIVKESCGNRNFSIDTVSERLGMTSAYLGKVFKKTTGETFSRFVLNERMSKACILLSETDEPIDSVIYSVGFGDTPYFYKLFKQVNGCTPARYRETYRRKG